MRLGAESNTRWLWFITYILLPVNVAVQIFGLFWFLQANQGGISTLAILAELCLAIATIVGLHRQTPWGWYCIMAVFGIQLIGTPIKVHAKASMRYEVAKAAYSDLQSQIRSPFTISQPSLFDVEPMATFLLLLGIWTTPNALYMYRRRHLFALQAASNCGIDQGRMPASPVAVSVPGSNVVTSCEEQAFADAQQEFDNGTLREGLLVKVSTEEQEPQKQRLLYIRYRAEQLYLESQQLDSMANDKWRKSQRRRQLFVTVLLFLIPLFSLSFFRVGSDLTGFLLWGFAMWALYGVLVLWGGCSRIWLVVPVVCLVCHFTGPWTWWKWRMILEGDAVIKETANGAIIIMPMDIVWLMGTVSLLAFPYYLMAMIRISRSSMPAVRRNACSMGAKRQAQPELM